MDTFSVIEALLLTKSDRVAGQAANLIRLSIVVVIQPIIGWAPSSLLCNFGINNLIELAELFPIESLGLLCHLFVWLGSKG